MIKLACRQACGAFFWLMNVQGPISHQVVLEDIRKQVGQAWGASQWAAVLHGLCLGTWWWNVSLNKPFLPHVAFGDIFINVIESKSEQLSNFLRKVHQSNIYCKRRKPLGYLILYIRSAFLNSNTFKYMTRNELASLMYLQICWKTLGYASNNLQTRRQ